MVGSMCPPHHGDADEVEETFICSILQAEQFEFLQRGERCHRHAKLAQVGVIVN